MTDNTTVIGQIRNQGGTHSLPLFRPTSQLLEWTDQQGITLIPRHIPGRLNVLADRLSRRHQILHSEWTLSREALHDLWKVWGQLHVDLYSLPCTESARLPVFVSPLPEPEAWRNDALSFPSTGLWAYAFPPTPLIPAVLQRVQTTQCQLILIAPAWPTQSWFPFLSILALTVDRPRQLPHTRRLLCQPGSGIFHPHPNRLNLHAWLISGPHSPTRDSLSKTSGGQNRRFPPPFHRHDLRQQVANLHRVVPAEGPGSPHSLYAGHSRFLQPAIHDQKPGCFYQRWLPHCYLPAPGEIYRRPSIRRTPDQPDQPVRSRATPAQPHHTELGLDPGTQRSSLRPIRALRQGSPMGTNLQDGVFSSPSHRKTAIRAACLLTSDSTPPPQLGRHHPAAGPALHRQD